MPDARSDKTERLRLYNAGLTDADIARATDAKANTITVWRRKLGLPVNKPLFVPADEDGRRLLFHSLGWSAHHIARECHVSKQSIFRWQLHRGLAPNFVQGFTEKNAPRPTMADVVAKCRRSVGRYLPRDIAEDAVSDLMLDVMTGKLALDKIGDAAKKYGNRVVAAFANKWGARSLDAEIGDSDGFTLMDTIADDSASSWLEEMGATVW